MTSVLLEELDCKTAVVGRISLDTLALISSLIPADRRASAYGIFNADFGLFWFLGSLLMAIPYDFSPPALIVSSMALQLIWIPVLLSVRKEPS